MKRYLDEMSKDELIRCAKNEKIFLGLRFNRDKIIEKLVKKGYEKTPPIEEAIEKIEKVEKEEKMGIKIDKIGGEIKNKENKEDVENNFYDNSTKIENEVEKVKEIDLSIEGIYKYRSKSYYRNYPSKKLIKRLKKRYRFKGIEKTINFTYKNLDENQIKIREVETEINKSKYLIGEEYEDNSIKNDIYFDKAPLPNSYFVDEIVLMPKNPTTLYVYWEIREETFEKLLKNNNIVDNIIIKLFKEGNEYKKVVRHERIGSHYITNVDASQNYEAYVGYDDIYGNFNEVAHSKLSIVPNDKISENLELIWGTVKEDKNTAQVIKYINNPTITPENKEFLELSGTYYLNNEVNETILERLLGVGSSEQLLEKNKLTKLGSSNIK